MMLLFRLFVCLGTPPYLDYLGNTLEAQSILWWKRRGGGDTWVLTNHHHPTRKAGAVKFDTKFVITSRREITSEI